MTEPTIAPEPLGSPDAQALIALLDAELTERYPNPDDNHFDLAAEEVAQGSGVFLVARAAGLPVGCAALRRIDAASGEVKRMYVAPAERGRGLGGRLLDELERTARALGLRRMVLETGEQQPESIRLYERSGFVRIERFGEYVDCPASVCMGKRLD
jgi:putative acetyltransferase